MVDGVPRIQYAEDDDEQNQTVLHATLALRAFPKKRPCLIVVSGARSVGRIFRLVDGDLTMGRALACDIVLEEEGVSRHHATVRVEPEGQVRVRDAGSANGLVYKGQRVPEVALTDGDRVDVGDAGIALLHMDDVDETLRQNLLESATIDDETKLLTRRYFREHLGRELGLASRYGMPVALMLCAVDAFRSLADSSGRGAALNALRRAIRLARDFISREDMFLARYAEDQIVIALPETRPEDCVIAANMLCRALASATMGPALSQGPNTTASIGVAVSKPGITSDALIELAEMSLYRAKIGGGNQVGPID